MWIEERGNVQKALIHLAPFKLANGRIQRQLSSASYRHIMRITRQLYHTICHKKQTKYTTSAKLAVM